jgi:hypothetical protein
MSAEASTSNAARLLPEAPLLFDNYRSWGFVMSDDLCLENHRYRSAPSFCPGKS